MNYWIIAHKPTKSWIPAGATHAEPTTKRPPRLFVSYQSAQSSLKWYLKGRVVWGPGTGGPWDSDSYQDIVLVSLEPESPRHSEDFIILPFDLVSNLRHNDGSPFSLTDAIEFYK